MNLTKQICHKAAHFDAVAFDVFDTLIKRDVAVPTGLFRLMGDDFYAARIRAEREARAAQSREVTLAEIYARPCLARYDAAAECAAELAACAANKPVLDAVQTLKKQGKKLYYISDMYLPQTQIDAMLRRCGYPCFDGGFVSCTYGVQKRSGRLFKRFLQETGLTAKQLLFIGDSWRADVAGAALAGALSMTFGCALRAPHGGIFVFPVVDHTLLYCVALAAGSVVGAVILSLLKKNRTDAA